MDLSPNLNLPLVAEGQASKHITVNEALLIMDGLMHLCVAQPPRDTPPDAPAEGSRWLVGPDPSGDWSGQAGELAVWSDGAWRFHPPRTGWLAYATDTGTLIVHNETGWEAVSPPLSIQRLTRLGVGTDADETNPLSVRLNNALFSALPTTEGGDGDLRFKLNKSAPGDTASLLYQTGFSGRAEVGLTADDDLTIKVSPDGSAWRDGLVVDRAHGVVRLPSNPRFRASLDHDQYIAAAAYTKVAFNVGDHDPLSDFSTSNNDYTVPVDGFYVFGAQVGFQSDGTPPTGAYSAFYVDGVRAQESEMRSTTMSHNLGFSNFTLARWMTAGTTVDVRVYFAGGGDSSLKGDTSQFWGVMIPSRYYT